MSRGPWKVEPETGLSRVKLGYVDWIDPNDVAASLAAKFPDSNIFNVRSMAAIVGRGRTYFVDRMLADPRSIFHVHREHVVDPRGRRVGTLYATHVQSLMNGMEKWVVAARGS